MKVLYFDQHFGTPKGATGSRSYEFSKALIRAGHQVTLVCGDYQRSALDLPEAPGGRWKRGEINGIDVISFPLRYSNRQSLRQRAVTFLKFAVRAMRIANSFEYDLLFASSTPLTVALPGISASVLRRKPFVFEVRDLWPDLPRALGLRNPLVLLGMKCLERSAYAAASGCIGLSPGIVEGIRDRSREGKPIAMIPNCSDIDLFRPGRREDLSIPGIAQGDFVAAFTGAHGVANGLETVIEAAAVLEDRGNSHVKFLLIGDGSEKPKLIEAARARRLTNCIFLDPVPREDLARLIGSVNCGLMILKNVPEFYRGTSPNKFFDYIAAGLPVVNNYPGWLADMITEWRCGRVVEPEDPTALADALEYLVRVPTSCLEMGKNARDLAEARFSRMEHAQRLVSFLEKQISE